MTPTPVGGFQGDHTFREFMERYGHLAKNGDGSRRFTGTHKVGSVSSTSGLGLRVSGYDPRADKFDAAVGIAVEMFNPATEEIAASWSLERLANCWKRKTCLSDVCAGRS